MLAIRTELGSTIETEHPVLGVGVRGKWTRDMYCSISGESG